MQWSSILCAILVVQNKVAEQHILRKYSNCNSFRVTMDLQYEFQSSYYSAIKCATSLKLYHVIAQQNQMNNIFEKICLTLILLKIFDIYVCHYFATNKKIAVTHLWHAMQPRTMYHLIAKDKAAEQYMLRKYSNCNSFGVTKALLNSNNFKVAITHLFNGNRSETLLYYSLSKIT